MDDPIEEYADTIADFAATAYLAGEFHDLLRLRKLPPAVRDQMLIDWYRAELAEQQTVFWSDDE